MDDPRLQQIFGLLKGSQEEKFAGLLLITRVLESHSPEILTAVHDAVGPGFLRSLLKSKEGM
jgi:neurochondrin